MPRAIDCATKYIVLLMLCLIIQCLVLTLDKAPECFISCICRYVLYILLYKPSFSAHFMAKKSPPLAYFQVNNCICINNCIKCCLETKIGALPYTQVILYVNIYGICIFVIFEVKTRNWNVSTVHEHNSPL